MLARRSIVCRNASSTDPVKSMPSARNVADISSLPSWADCICFWKITVVEVSDSNDWPTNAAPALSP